MAKIRTFIALELPEALKKAFANLQARLREQTDCVRWVRPDHIHLTLKFLGPTDEGLVEPVSRILENISKSAPPFSLMMAGIGAFPNTRNPKVVWAGMQGPIDTLIKFQASLEQALSVVGFAQEKRPFAPHLTLGRVKDSRGKKNLEMVLEKFKAQEIGTYTADTIVFYRSDLQPAGPIYSALKTIQLSRSC
jgi:2'-5' RNA ligase